MLDLDVVRQMAKHNGFEEVQMNEVSRVIAFKKDGPWPRCRINVYYTTGTVATCLDHPRSGKTQLFRRGQTIDDLDSIFRNPRKHTGVGYFRNNGREDWQPVNGQDDLSRRVNSFHRSECDDALRWRYIHSTQEGFCNVRQADQISALCRLWHQLRFAPPNGQHIVTLAEKFNNMSPEELGNFNDSLRQVGAPSISICRDCNETGCKCMERAGAWCSTLGVVLKVAHDTDGVVDFFEKENKVDGKIMDIRQVINCTCDDGLLYRQRHSTFLQKLERQFRSFPSRIRRELLHWFMTKSMHGFEPFLLNPDYDPDTDAGRENSPILTYGHNFCSNEILRAHYDYGDMNYDEGGKGCRCHGI